MTIQGQALSIRDEADSLKAQVQGDFTTEAFTIIHTLYFLCRIMMRLCKLSCNNYADFIFWLPVKFIECVSILHCFFNTDIRSRISELEDMKNRRLEHLRNRYKDTYNAVLWLRANQHKFHAPIHEPILLQASCAPIAWSRRSFASFTKYIVLQGTSCHPGLVFTSEIT